MLNFGNDLFSSAFSDMRPTFLFSPICFFSCLILSVDARPQSNAAVTDKELRIPRLAGVCDGKVVAGLVNENHKKRTRNPGPDNLNAI